MKVSVSIVTYQQVGYIRQAVESALAQEADFPFEVIVGDDASSDGSREVLEELRAAHPERVRLLLAPSNYGDFGLSNVMATLDAATGEYVAFLDGDDYWTDPRKLQRQIAFMDAHPDCAVSAHRVIHVGGDGPERLSVRPGEGDGLHDLDLLLQTNFTPKSATVVRRSALADLPPWYRRTKVASAAWLLNLLAARHGRVGFLDSLMAAHRLHSGSVTSFYGEKRLLADKLAAYELLRPYFPGREAAFRRAERRVRRKLMMLGLSPRGYRSVRRLYELASARRA